MECVPSSLLLDFFDSATAQLNQHPLRQQQGKKSCPPSLDEQRRMLLKIQLESLEQAVASYNNANGLGDTPDAVTLVDAQAALRDCDFAAARVMEAAARSAFARSVLLSEMEWDLNVCDKRDNTTTEEQEKLRGLMDGDSADTMSRDSIKEFCGLCVEVLNMPEVQEYLVKGSDIHFGTQQIRDDDRSVSDKESTNEQQKQDGTSMTSPERMECIQRLLLRAVGYNAGFAKTEMQKIFFADDLDASRNISGGLDPELEDAFTKFLNAMSVSASRAAASANGGAEGTLLSDGNTKVISVHHSERTVAGSEGDQFTMSSGAVPLAQSMEEHDDERQRRQLGMARQAAALQQGLLTELESMNEDERNKVLDEAGEAHLLFLKKMSELPIGEERLNFLQSIDSETQRKLAIHKLWEVRSQHGR
mmetsp:Transcript_17484/g.37919  ORF Transcript_17484/g.37919 Transcript_17484/m.37919 type:complete len:419 (-) Transcript_17484:51-1307(-)